jgi:lysyl-tRNA synthetase class I
MCGAIYLNGSKTVCNRCGRIKEHGKVRMDTRIRFRCDCGAMAVNVILVEVGAEGEHQEVRLAVCEVCLEEERRTMRLLRERK